MIFLADTTATEQLGQRLAVLCQAPCVLHLAGELGAGKTTLTRGFLQQLGHRGVVKSPTYTLVEPYQLGTCTVYHFDLYRLGDPEELDYLGIRDYLSDSAVCLIEWADRGGAWTPSADVVVELQYQHEARQALLHGISALGEKIVKRLIVR